MQVSRKLKKALTKLFDYISKKGIQNCLNKPLITFSSVNETGLSELKDEKITFDCIHKIVECSNHYIDFYTNKPTGAHSTFYKDFNYVYPRLVNNTRENLNRFYFNIRCYSVEFHYNPIRKVGALV